MSLTQRNRVMEAVAATQIRAGDTQTTRVRQPGVVHAPVALLLFYFGLAAALPVWFELHTGVISIAFLAAVALGLAGWLEGLPGPVRRIYLPVAAALALWFVIAAIASWRFDTLYFTGSTVVMLLVVVPGIAALARSRVNRWSLVAGLAVGTGVFALAAVSRLLGGPFSEIAPAIHRNAVNYRVPLVVSFLVVLPLARLRWIRWIAIAMFVALVLSNGGRAGLAGIVIVAVVHSALQLGGARKLASLVVVVALAGLVFAGVSRTDGPLGHTTERLLQQIRGESVPGDDARPLLLRRAMSLARQNPVFGIGLGNVPGAYDEVVEEAPTRRLRTIVLTYQAHNTYAEVAASAGFPGAAGFVALLMAVSWVGWRGRAEPDARAGLAALCAMLAAIAYHSALGNVLFVTLALVLATAHDADQPAASDPSLT